MAKQIGDVAKEAFEKAGEVLTEVGDSLKKNADDVAEDIRKQAEARRDLDGEMGPGEFKSVNRNHKYKQQKLGAEYEKQVTGRDDGTEYAVEGSRGNEVKFDGFDGEKLQETKHGYGAMVNESGSLNGAQKEKWLDQAQRQVDAADGTPIEWVFSNESARQAADELFFEYDLDISTRQQDFVPPGSDWEGWKSPDIPKKKGE